MKLYIHEENMPDIADSYQYYRCISNIQGVTEIPVQIWTMPIKTKNKTFYTNDKKRLTA